jgi:hypothetical protein
MARPVRAVSAWPLISDWRGIAAHSVLSVFPAGAEPWRAGAVSRFGEADRMRRDRRERPRRGGRERDNGAPGRRHSAAPLRRRVA